MRSVYRELSPTPRLARYVECYWTREDRLAAHDHVVLPDGCVDILFSTLKGEPIALNVVGLMTRPMRIDLAAGQSFFGVRFHPGMAHAFFPVAAVLRDKTEPLENIWGRAARVLSERLAETPEPLEKAKEVEGFLRPLEPADPVRRVLWHLPKTEFTLNQLVSEAGLSERHFRRECLERTGISPKYLRRILRFRDAVERIRALAGSAAQPSWAQLAAACNYYDQAHLTHDFQEFAGCTPGRFLQSLDSPLRVESKNHESTEAGKSNRLH